MSVFCIVFEKFKRKLEMETFCQIFIHLSQIGYSAMTDQYKKKQIIVSILVITMSSVSQTNRYPISMQDKVESIHIQQTSILHYHVNEEALLQFVSIINERQKERNTHFHQITKRRMFLFHLLHHFLQWKHQSGKIQKMIF